MENKAGYKFAESFDKLKHIERMMPHVEELNKLLLEFGIIFYPYDENGLENIIYTDGVKTLKIAHRCFYRFSGMCVIRKEIDKNRIELVEVTDRMFILSYMGTLIKNKFNII